MSTSSDHRLDKATLGLPLFLEDTTGFPRGPTNFYDIYDRPPFIHVRTRVDVILKRIKIDFFELEMTYPSPPHDMSLSRVTQCQCRPNDALVRDGISLYLEQEVDGPKNVVWINLNKTQKCVPVDSWLYKSENGRQFQALDGETYRWFFRCTATGYNDWTCMNLERNEVVAHYDLKSEFEPPYATSGNVLIVYELWTDLTLELIASLFMMRHLLSIGAL